MARWRWRRRRRRTSAPTRPMARPPRGTQRCTRHGRVTTVSSTGSFRRRRRRCGLLGISTTWASSRRPRHRTRCWSRGAARCVGVIIFTLAQHAYTHANRSHQIAVLWLLHDDARAHVADAGHDESIVLARLVVVIGVHKIRFALEVEMGAALVQPVDIAHHLRAPGRLAGLPRGPHRPFHRPRGRLGLRGVLRPRQVLRWLRVSSSGLLACCTGAATVRGRRMKKNSARKRAIVQIRTVLRDPPPPLPPR